VLEAVQGWVERALLDPEQFVGDLLDALGDRPAVGRLEGDRAHDEEVERALNQVSLILHASLL
jgi:hypothetical protein